MDELQTNKIIYSMAKSPQNYKKGKLILGKYRPFDIGLMVIAVLCFSASLLLALFVIMPSIMFVLIFSVCIPVLLVGIVQPMDNYHNYLEYLRLSILFHRKNKYFTNLIVFQKRKEKSKKR